MEVGNAARSAKSAVWHECGASFGLPVGPGGLSGGDGFPAACCWDHLVLFYDEVSLGENCSLAGEPGIPLQQEQMEISCDGFPIF